MVQVQCREFSWNNIYAVISLFLEQQGKPQNATYQRIEFTHTYDAAYLMQVQVLLIMMQQYVEADKQKTQK